MTTRDKRSGFPQAKRVEDKIPAAFLENTEEVVEEEEDEVQKKEADNIDFSDMETEELPEEDKKESYTHPGLRLLNKVFGLKTLINYPEREVGPFKWGFRPLGVQDYRWITDKCAEIAQVHAANERTVVSKNGLTLLTEAVMGCLAVAYVVIDGNKIPTYEMFKLKSKYKIVDKFDPPADVKYLAAMHLYNVATGWKPGVLRNFFESYNELYDSNNNVQSWLSDGNVLYICPTDGAIFPSMKGNEKIHCNLCGTPMLVAGQTANTYECVHDGAQLTYPANDFFIPHCTLCGVEMKKMGSPNDPLG